MQADPQVGIDLPLRMLVWAQDGRTRVGYRDPRGLSVDPASAEVAAVLGRMNGLLERLAREAAGADRRRGRHIGADCRDVVVDPQPS